MSRSPFPIIRGLVRGTSRTTDLATPGDKSWLDILQVVMKPGARYDFRQLRFELLRLVGPNAQQRPLYEQLHDATESTLIERLRPHVRYDGESFFSNIGSGSLPLLTEATVLHLLALEQRFREHQRDNPLPPTDSALPEDVKKLEAALPVAEVLYKEIETFVGRSDGLTEWAHRYCGEVLIRGGAMRLPLYGTRLDRSALMMLADNMEQGRWALLTRSDSWVKQIKERREEIIVAVCERLAAQEKSLKGRQGYLTRLLKEEPLAALPEEATRTDLQTTYEGYQAWVEKVSFAKKRFFKWLAELKTTAHGWLVVQDSRLRTQVELTKSRCDEVTGQARQVVEDRFAMVATSYKRSEDALPRPPLHRLAAMVEEGGFDGNGDDSWLTEPGAVTVKEWRGIVGHWRTGGALLSQDQTFLIERGTAARVQAWSAQRRDDLLVHDIVGHPIQLQAGERAVFLRDVSGTEPLGDYGRLIDRLSQLGDTPSLLLDLMYDIFVRSGDHEIQRIMSSHLLCLDGTDVGDLTRQCSALVTSLGYRPLYGGATYQSKREQLALALASLEIILPRERRQRSNIRLRQWNESLLFEVLTVDFLLQELCRLLDFCNVRRPPPYYQTEEEAVQVGLHYLSLLPDEILGRITPDEAEAAMAAPQQEAHIRTQPVFVDYQATRTPRALLKAALVALAQMESMSRRPSREQGLIKRLSVETKTTVEQALRNAAGRHGSLSLVEQWFPQGTISDFFRPFLQLSLRELMTRSEQCLELCELTGDDFQYVDPVSSRVALSVRLQRLAEHLETPVGQPLFQRAVRPTSLTDLQLHYAVVEEAIQRHVQRFAWGPEEIAPFLQ